jgi:hypothetical protein
MPPKLKDKQKIPLPPAIISSDPITSNNSQPISSQNPINPTNPTRKRSGTVSIYNHEPLPKSVKDAGNSNISMYATSDCIQPSSLPTNPQILKKSLQDLGLMDPISDEEEEEIVENMENQEEDLVASIVGQITTTFKILFKKQNLKIKQLEDKIDILLKNSTTTPSLLKNTTSTTTNLQQPWNQVAASSKSSTSNPAKTFPDQKSISKKSRTFTILRNTTADNQSINPLQIRDCINHALLDAKASPQLKVASATLNPRGNIVVLTKDNCTATEVLKFQDQIQKAVNSLDKHTENIQTSEDWAKVLVHGIHQEYFPDTIDGMEKLKKEIEDFNSRVKVMNTPRYLLRPERRNGKQHSSVVFAVQNKEVLKSIVKSGLHAMGNSQKVEEFYSVRPVDQCPKCQGFGHHHQRCKKAATCRICSAEHLTSEHKCGNCKAVGKLCPHYTPKCINCSGKHKANDPSCPTITILNSRYQKTTPLAVTSTTINE